MTHESTHDAFADLADRYQRTTDGAATVSDLLAERARSSPDQTYVIFGDRSISFGELDRRVTELALGLRALGVEAGERVAFMAENSPELVELLFATWRMGAVAVPLNIFLRGASLQHQLRDSGATTLVVDSEGVDAASPHLAELRRLVTIGDEPPGESFTAGVPSASAASLASMGAGGDAAQIDRSQDGPAAILYTSGTTGAAKGCVVGQRYLLHMGREYVALWHTQPNDVVLNVSPLYHVSGLAPLLLGLAGAIPVVVEKGFSASNFLARACETGATLSCGVAFVVTALLAREPSAVDRRHRLRLMLSAPVTETDRDRFIERFGIELLTEQYGQTEFLVMTANVEGAPRSPGSAGRPLPWTDVRILLESGEEAPPGVVGEIVARPRAEGVMFDGYWNRDDATDRSFRDGWYHTGDLGKMMTTDGFVTFVDRETDSIRRRGENISAFELERAINQVAAVAEVAVHGVRLPDEPEEAVKACIVLAPGATLTATELVRELRNEVPYYALPRFVALVPSLPRNASGRVMKYLLKERPLEDVTWDLERLGLLVARDARRRLEAGT